jgi:hypothetical protein
MLSAKHLVDCRLPQPPRHSTSKSRRPPKGLPDNCFCAGALETLRRLANARWWRSGADSQHAAPLTANVETKTLGGTCMHIRGVAGAATIAAGVGMSALLGSPLVNAAPSDPPPPCSNCQGGPGGVGAGPQNNPVADPPPGQTPPRMGSGPGPKGGHAPPKS